MDETREIRERRLDVGGLQINLRERPGEGVPTVFVHGVPTHSADWVPFLEVLEGPGIAPDLPGFGSSDPLPTGAATLHGYSAWFEQLIEVLGLERYNLVVHDWGGVALHAAQSHPERINRLVVVNTVPLLPGYRWHWVARIWRTRFAGEAFNRIATRPATAALMRLARHGRAAMPREFIDMVWEGWSPAMTASVLSLYRSADPEVLEAAGAGLTSIEAPALVVWGKSDPYIPTSFARSYAGRIPNADLAEISRAGHWPWIDRPETIDRIVGFLEDPA